MAIRWDDITEQAFYGDYNGYIRFANQVLNVTGAASASSANGLRVFNVEAGQSYRVTMEMRNRFRLGCVATMTSGQTITNYIFDELDNNDATDQGGAVRVLEITPLGSQVLLCVGAWSTGASAPLFDTLNSIVLEVAVEAPDDPPPGPGPELRERLQLRRGMNETIPQLAEGEPGFARDTLRLFLGTALGNVLMASANAAAGMFERVRLLVRTRVADAPNGTIFEDTDGNLNYKNLDGEVGALGSVVTPTVITDNLYASMGDIAELRVDWLSTENRIQRYLQRDVTDMPYTDIYGQLDYRIIAQVVMSGTTPQTEQLRNRKNQLLYWDKPITNATITNGYPYIGGVRVTTTAEAVDGEGVARQPVTVYRYNLYAKLKIGFGWDDDMGEFIPQIVLGAGSSGAAGQEDYGKFFITKKVDRALMEYVTQAGVAVPMSFNDDGFIDAKLRRLESLEINTNTGNIIYTLEADTTDGLPEEYNARYETASVGNEDILTMYHADNFITQVKILR